MRLKNGLVLMDIEGYCDPKFQAVADAFTRCFTEHGEIGAPFAVTVEGEMVVDLWGGFMDEEVTQPWKEQTPCIIFSATKGVVTTAVHRLVARLPDSTLLAGVRSERQATRPRASGGECSGVSEATATAFENIKKIDNCCFDATDREWVHCAYSLATFSHEFSVQRRQLHT